MILYLVNVLPDNALRMMGSPSSILGVSWVIVSTPVR